MAAPVPPTLELIAAALKGDLETVKALITQDPVCVHAKDAEGRTALQVAAEHVVWDSPNHHEIAKLLAACGSSCDIFTAARAGLLEQAGKLLADNPELLNAEDGLGRTPLQRAALVYGSCKECEAVAEFLIQRGAKVDVFTACALGKTAVVRDWLAKERKLVHARCLGGTPLHWAVRPRNYSPAVIEVCALLLDNRADLNAEDSAETGMSVLHHAAAWGNPPELAAFLIDRGAEMNLRDEAGWTPLDYANDRGSRAMAEFLRSRGAKETTAKAATKFGARAREMIEAAKRGDLDALSAMLAENPGIVNTRGDWGETPLHWAAQNGHLIVAELLLKRGADANAEAALKHGGTPLAWAAERRPDLVRLLHEHGAEINAVNERTGQRPLHCCARCDDCAEVAEYLLAHGANVNTRDQSGRTPLSYAYELGHNSVVAVLKRHGGKE